jgi:tetratricopeptide (TPR) repeat protein
VETLAEVGVIGLVLLLVCFALLIVAGVRVVMRSPDDVRTRAAGAVAAMLAFMTAALVDWVWQLPVLPAAFLLLAAAVLAPAPAAFTARLAGAGQDPARDEDARPFVRLAARGGWIIAAVACLAAVGVPLGSASDVRQSQAASTAGDTSAALADVRSALNVEPGAASAELQLALVQELRHDYRAAVLAAKAATRDESQNWSTWLVLSRLQAEAGEVDASIASYRRARALNPQSTLFHQ